MSAWSCRRCTFHNRPLALACGMCAAIKSDEEPVEAERPDTTMEPSGPAQSAPPQPHHPPPPPSPMMVRVESQTANYNDASKREWACNSCSLLNAPDSGRCAVCDSVRPPTLHHGADISAQSAAASCNPAYMPAAALPRSALSSAAAAASSSFAAAAASAAAPRRSASSAVQLAPGQWVCQSCTFLHHEGAGEGRACEVCATPSERRVGASAASASPSAAAASPTGAWLCSVCSLLNLADAPRCVVCQHINPCIAASSASSSAAAASAAPSSSSGVSDPSGEESAASQWREIMSICSSIGSNFVDDSFRAGDRSIKGSASNALELSTRRIPVLDPAGNIVGSKSWGPFTWRRAGALGGMAKNSSAPWTLLPRHADGSVNIQPQDIRQGELNNCWWISAVSVLAERPALLSHLMLTQELNEVGAYQVRFCKGGTWVVVTVDDFLPVDPETNRLAFSHTPNNELWVSILEKGYAKLHSCLSFSTLVRVHGQPEPVPVESLKVGDQLVGEDLSPVTVTRIGVGTAASMIRLCYDGGSHLVTRDHLVTLQCGRNPSVQLERTAGGAAVLTLAWDEPTLNATGTDIRRYRSWRIADAGVSAAHSISGDSDADASLHPPALPAEMAPHAEQFALWWLSGLQARSKGAYNPMRAGDLFELRAASLLTVSEAFLDCVGIPQAPSSDLAQLGWADEAATVAVAPAVAASSDRDLSGSFGSEIELVECFLQMKGLTDKATGQRFHPAAVDTPDIVYVLHKSTSGESMKNTRGVMETMWRMLDVSGLNVMISEIESNANYRRSMEAAIMCGADKIVVFGADGYKQWMQTVDLCEGVRSTKMECDEATGRQRLLITRTDGSTAQVLFTAHPSSRRLFRHVLSAVAFAHGQTVPVAWVEHAEFKHIRRVEEVRGECKFVPIEVTGTGRFVLGDNCITHNCYAAIESGSICDAFVDLTGAPAERIDLHVDEMSKFAADKWTRNCGGDPVHARQILWATILSFRQSKFLMGASCGRRGVAAEEYKRVGLRSDHAYALLDARFESGIQFLKLRNPWGTHSWTGDWSAASPLWTPALRRALNYPAPTAAASALLSRSPVAAHQSLSDQSGCFWINLDDFLLYFRTIDVCKYQDDWHVVRLADSVSLEGWSPSGQRLLPAHVGWSSECMYELAVPHSTCVFISLIQRDLRGTDAPKPHAYRNLGLFLLKSRDGTSTPESSLASYQRCAEVFPESQRMSTCEALLTDKNGRYLLMPCSYAATLANGEGDAAFSSSSSSSSSSSAAASSSSASKSASSFPFVLCIYSAYPILVKRRPMCVSALTWGLGLGVTLAGESKPLGSDGMASLLTFECQGGLWFVVVNRHPSKYLSIAVDCTQSTGLHSSRRSAHAGASPFKTLDLVPPRHRQLLLALLTSRAELGYAYSRSCTFMHVEGRSLQQQPHMPPLRRGFDIHQPVCIDDGRIEEIQ